jgi:hypothetical protein
MNNQLVTEISPPKHLRKRRDDPVDVTAFLKTTLPGTSGNVLRIEVRDCFVDGAEYGCGLVLCETRSEEELMSTVRSEERSTCLGRIQGILGERSELEAEEGDERTVELTCPISQMIMTRPCRGNNCSHLRVFDLEAYLFANKHMSNINTRWKCPICQKKAPPENLVIDNFFLELVTDSQRPQHSNHVLLSVHGTWKFSTQAATTTDSPEEDEEEYTNTEHKEPVVCLSDAEEPPKKRKRPCAEVIDLSDD